MPNDYLHISSITYTELRNRYYGNADQNKIIITEAIGVITHQRVLMGKQKGEMHHCEEWITNMSCSYNTQWLAENTTMTWFNGDSSQVKVKRMTKDKV
jgi:hypothetical protein